MPNTNHLIGQSDKYSFLPWRFMKPFHLVPLGPLDLCLLLTTTVFSVCCCVSAAFAWEYSAYMFLINRFSWVVNKVGILEWLYPTITLQVIQQVYEMTDFIFHSKVLPHAMLSHVVLVLLL